MFFFAITFCFFLWSFCSCCICSLSYSSDHSDGTTLALVGLTKYKRVSISKTKHFFAKKISFISYFLKKKRYVQKQPPEVFCKGRFSWKFRKIHKKTHFQSLVLNKVSGLRSATLLKKRLWHRCFPVNFAKFLRAPFLQNTFKRRLLYTVNTQI